MRETINLNQYRKIVFLTGAGVSVGSGLKPYRGAGGVWEENDVKTAGHIDALSADPESVWKLFGKLRIDVQHAKPNKTHDIIAGIERALSADQSFCLITQNVDDLHQQSGSVNVVELHGSIHLTKCSNVGCDLAAFVDSNAYLDMCPYCKNCNSPLRPDIVLFGERIPVDREWRVKQALRDCDLFIAVGTSGTVWPAANYVRSAKYENARTISINIEKQTPRNPYFDEEYVSDAAETLERLFN